MPDRCLIVAPHPDDETIGTAVWMARRPDWEITLLHLTDGSPRDLRWARERGFSSRKAYASARRRELRAALAVLGAGRRRLRVLSYTDGESCRHLAEMTARIAAIIAGLQPAIVLSPSYEGGHPDHDAAAFAVAASRRLVTHPFRHREYRLYHGSTDGAMMTDDFLPQPGCQPEVSLLTSAEKSVKGRMLACFKSQMETLRPFPLEDERFREAPPYDFSRPPHDGTLLYEQWNLGISGEDWRRFAGHALSTLQGGKSNQK